MNTEKSIEEQLKEANEFISQLAAHCREVEEELIEWREGKRKRKSKSPYLNGEFSGTWSPGIGYIP